MRYRAEIDGLRALAVVPVILFHAGFDSFSGGFVGVDVFFVISGYLITTIIVEDIEGNRFSIVRFYERRARRILPALFFVMFACIPFAWFLMLPSQLKDFSQSFVAVSFFASNILFWHETDYFAESAEEKPLLHTWSLAVEEQYYVLFPIFLFLAWRLGKDRVFWLIVVFSAISLALSEWGWRNSPSANFYLAPMRAWELLSGSIAAFIVQKRGIQANNLLSMIGLVAIMFAILAYDEHTPFPSLYSLVPVVGVVLLVLYADKETLAARFLSSKVLVGIGLISYSVYLWHQPLFAFIRIAHVEAVMPHVFMVAIAATFVLAYFSWKYVETPFLNKYNFTRRRILSGSLAGVVFFVGLGLYGHMVEVQGHRINSLENLAFSEESTEFKRSCAFGDPMVDENCSVIGDVDTSPKTLIVGDSHARAMKSSLANAFLEKDESAVFVGMPGCTPIRGVAILHPSVFEDCVDLNDRVYSAVVDSYGFKNIVVISRWTSHWEGTPFDNGEGGVEVFRVAGGPLTGVINGEATTDKSEISQLYEKSLRYLSDISNLVLVYPVPEAGWNVPKRLSALHLWEMDVNEATLSTSSSLFAVRNSEIFSLFDGFDFDFAKVLPSEIFCESYLEGRCVTHLNGRNLYYDSNHLSEFGARLVVEEIFDHLR
ncbi:acyltransferase family protein [Halomonas denitrificans]|uniref:acyltransferase family protein n=1 Tax=Halomonas denitrificans TaxID=370769 RepID=UPI001300BAE0|nr:acyltransferase family protein [Halomonas denitrificans]